VFRVRAAAAPVLSAAELEAKQLLEAAKKPAPSFDDVKVEKKERKKKESGKKPKAGSKAAKAAEEKKKAEEAAAKAALDALNAATAAAAAAAAEAAAAAAEASRFGMGGQSSLGSGPGYEWASVLAHEQKFILVRTTDKAVDMTPLGGKISHVSLRRALTEHFTALVEAKHSLPNSFTRVDLSRDALLMQQTVRRVLNLTRVFTFF
jgi:hypothetical protein